MSILIVLVIVVLNPGPSRLPLMDRVPWPVMLAAGIVGGAVGTIGLAWLIAATKIDDALNHR